MKRNLITLVSSLLVLFSFSQDRIFSYTYQSNVLNKGDKELEVWTTVSQTKDDFYRKIANRFEFEIGLGSNLQTAFYVNTKQEAGYDDITGEIAVKPSEISFSNEWKYKFSDPVAHKIGSAAYFEWTIAPDELELELKLILDKKLGKTLHAFNATFEPEWKATTNDAGKKTTELEYKYNFNYAFAYEINKNWNIGFEALNKNVNLKEATRVTHAALFMGPVFSYNSGKFWANFTFLPQVAGLNNPNGSSGLNTAEFTKFDTRLIFSFQF